MGSGCDDINETGENPLTSGRIGNGASHEDGRRRVARAVLNQLLVFGGGKGGNGSDDANELPADDPSDDAEFGSSGGRDLLSSQRAQPSELKLHSLPLL